MSYMFYECLKIESFPDISGWETINVNDMSYMFSECKKLKVLPNTSKWTINNKNSENMFLGCSKLK